MSTEFRLADDFGAHLASGDVAAQYRLTKLEPLIARGETVVLDFSGVRNANSSFMNALIAGILEQRGEEVLDRLIFRNCNSGLRVFVSSAVELGLEKHDQRRACA